MHITTGSAVRTKISEWLKCFTYRLITSIIMLKMILVLLLLLLMAKLMMMKIYKRFPQEQAKLWIILAIPIPEYGQSNAPLMGWIYWTFEKSLNFDS